MCAAQGLPGARQALDELGGLLPSLQIPKDDRSSYERAYAGFAARARNDDITAKHCLATEDGARALQRMGLSAEERALVLIGLGGIPQPDAFALAGYRTSCDAVGPDREYAARNGLSIDILDSFDSRTLGLELAR